MAIAGGALIKDAWLRGDVGTVRTVADELLPVAERANLPYLRGDVLRYLRRAGVRADPFPGSDALPLHPGGLPTDVGSRVLA